MIESDCDKAVFRSKKTKIGSLMRYLQGPDLVAPGVPLCAGCTVELALRTLSKTMGGNTILFTTPGCAASAIVSKGLAPTIKLSTFGCLLTNVPSVMTGVKRYFRRKGQNVECVAFVGDGCSSDVGFQPLSGAAERNENIIYICYDNEAYMNTGNQRSGTTPKGARTTTTPVGTSGMGKKNEGKNLPYIMACHNISYAATACVGFLHDFVKKVNKAQSVKTGMSYIHLLTPCVVGWGFKASESLEVSRLAVNVNYFPLWESEDGQLRLTYEPKRRRGVESFLNCQARFSHFQREDIIYFQEMVDRRYANLKALSKLPAIRDEIFESLTGSS